MVTKRYIKKGGKTYGPYFYESYRDRDGNVKKRYIKDYKPSSQQNKLKISFAIIAVIAVSFLFYSFLISEATKTLTGKAVFLEKKVYSPGERLNGEILLNVKSGELIPKDVKVTINLGSTKEEFILSEFVDFTLTEGEFFAENSDLKGTGLGYGEAGTKTTHPTINFELEIYETSQESGGDSDDVEYSPSTEDEADTIGNEEEVTEDEGNTEESESSTESETPEEVTEPEETSESPITGEVISEPENKIIGGQASYENDFTYTLEPNQKARIVPDSVNIDDEQISNSELSLKIENNQVVVSTAYSTTEKGFGADFIGEDVALTFKINVADLELAASPGELEVKLSYKNKEIAFYSETIHVSEIEISLNETNKTEEQIEILTLLKEIPSIRIPSGQSTTLNLKEYFENAESYEIIVESITTKIEEHILELIPEPDFSGAKKTKLIAQSGEQTLESNEFMILVSSGAVDIKTSRKQIRLGETVKWKTEVYKGNPEESLSIEIPKDAENLNIKKLKDGIVIEDENLKVGITGNSILTGDVIIEVNLKKEEENAIVKKLKSWMANLKSRITKQLGITGKSISSEEIVEDETVDVVLEDSVAEEYLIEYETPPPRSTETETKDGKLITITGPDSVEYTDVIAFTELDNTIKVSEDKIKLYWRNYEYEQLGEEEIIEAVTKEVKDVPEEEIVEEISLNENNETNSSSNILTGNVISAESSLGENTLASEQRTEQNYIKQAVLFDAYDLDFDGFIDYVEWVVPHLSNQTYEIIIEITNAEHLDESRAFISNIYDEVKALDDNWSETIPENHYTRVVFESNLTSTNDITLFPRIISGAPRIEIYEKNQTQKIAEFSSLNENQYNQVYLTNLQGVQDTFDLLILDGAVQFDHIIDPTIEGPPIITIVAPLNNSNLDTENPDFNVSLNEDGSWCGFSVDGAANITLTAFNSTYFFDNRTLKAGFSDGSHSVVFSCNDTDGEMGTSEGSYFLIDTTNPAINFTNPTPSNNTVVTTAFINVSSSDANAHYTFLDIDNDLVLWMRMDDTNASGDPTDLSSYSNNGSKQGNAAQTSVGYFGKGFEFDGNGDSVSISNSANNKFIESDQYTWVFWMKPTSESEQALISKGSVEGGYEIFYESNKTIFRDEYDSGGVSSTAVVKPNQWTQVALVYDGTCNVDFYVNGAYDNSAPSPGDCYSSTNANVNIGFHTSHGDYNGTIDEVLIFNRSLSSTEISALYNASANQYYNNFTSLAEGNHLFTGYTVDIAGNKNQTEQRTVTIESDATSPTITIISPLNNSNYNTNSIEFNISANENLSWCGLSISGATNQTMTLNASFTGANSTNSSIDGSYSFVITCNDTANNYGTSDLHYLLIDTINPTINFTDPTPANNSVVTTAFINVSSSDANDHYTFLDLDNDLVLWMRMDDTNASGDPTDLSSYSNNGTKQGNAAQTTAGYFGKGFEFDGKMDYIALPSSNLLNLSIESSSAKNYTFSLWVKRKSDGIQDILTLFEYECHDDGGYQIRIYKGNLSYKKCDGAPSMNYPGAVSDAQIPLNTWTFVTAKVNMAGTDPATGTIDFYVNGAYVNSVSSSAEDSGVDFANKKTRIGISYDGGPGGYGFNGTIDEVMVFNRSLSAQEILALYNASANQYQNNFTSLNDGSHTFTGYTVDKTGNQNQTEQRTVTIDATSPTISFISPTENNGELSDAGGIYVNVSVTETNENTITFNLYNSSVYLVNSTSFTDQTHELNFAGLSDDTYTYNVVVNDTLGNSANTASITLKLISSCLDQSTCTESSTCATNSDCVLHSDLCANSVCDFTALTLNSNIYTLYNSNKNGRNLILNITSNATRSQLTFAPNSSFIFKGKNGTNIGSGSSGGNGGTINLTVRDLLNTTNGRFTGTGGYTTASAASGGNGGILQLNFHGLIRNFTLGTATAPTLFAGSSTDLVFGTGGTLIYNKDLVTCPRDADVTGDGRILPADWQTIEYYYNLQSGETNFEENYDINCDNKLNVAEMARIGFELGTR